MMMLVVLFHSILFFGGEWFTFITSKYTFGYYNNIVNILSTIHVPTFMFASGYLYFMQKELGNY